MLCIKPLCAPLWEKTLRRMKAFWLKRVHYALFYSRVEFGFHSVTKCNNLKSCEFWCRPALLSDLALFIFTSLAWEQSQGPMVTIVPGSRDNLPGSICSNQRYTKMCSCSFNSLESQQTLPFIAAAGMLRWISLWPISTYDVQEQLGEQAGL